MEVIRSGEDIQRDQQTEVVLTYRQRPAEPEAVVLRYERALPEAMRPEEEGSGGAKETGVGAAPRHSAVNPPEKKGKSWGIRLYVAVSLLVILICLGVGIRYMGQHRNTGDGGRPSAGDHLPPPGYYYGDGQEPEDETITIPTYPTGGATRLRLISAENLPELTLKEIYDQVSPAVVTVLGEQKLYSSVGTGVIFSEDGYILTNCHIIAGCSACQVWLTDEYGVDSEYEARVVGCDADVDLAVLKIEGVDLPTASFGVSDDLQVGDPTYAIGNPLGVELRNTLTDGIVSAIDRDVDVDGVTMTLIQTTAALNSGNSGGPLINRYGQVIGINTIKMMSEYDTIEGLGFAIPSSLAVRWVNELIEFGELQPQPVLGVKIRRIPETLPDGSTGLRIETVTPGGSADRAGLRVGDYLMTFNGQAVSTIQQVLTIRRDLRVGDQVPFRIYRDGSYLDMEMIMMAE